MIVTTKTGSKYRVDFDAKTWERVHYLDDSGIRVKLHYTEIRIVAGEPMELLCAPLVLGGMPRYIETSDVVSLEEE